MKSKIISQNKNASVLLVALILLIIGGMASMIWLNMSVSRHMGVEAFKNNVLNGIVEDNSIQLAKAFAVLNCTKNAIPAQQGRIGPARIDVKYGAIKSSGFSGNPVLSVEKSPYNHFSWYHEDIKKVFSKEIIVQVSSKMIHESLPEDELLWKEHRFFIKSVNPILGGDVLTVLNNKSTPSTQNLAATSVNLLNGRYLDPNPTTGVPQNIQYAHINKLGQYDASLPTNLYNFPIPNFITNIYAADNTDSESIRKKFVNRMAIANFWTNGTPFTVNTILSKIQDSGTYNINGSLLYGVETFTAKRPDVSTPYNPFTSENRKRRITDHERVLNGEEDGPVDGTVRIEASNKMLQNISLKSNITSVTIENRFPENNVLGNDIPDDDNYYDGDVSSLPPMIIYVEDPTVTEIIFKGTGSERSIIVAAGRSISNTLNLRFEPVSTWRLIAMSEEQSLSITGGGTVNITGGFWLGATQRNLITNGTTVNISKEEKVSADEKSALHTFLPRHIWVEHVSQ